MNNNFANFVLTISCPNQIGIVYAVSRFLVKYRCNITNSSQFDDSQSGQFFIRIAFQSTEEMQIDDFENDLASLAAEYNMEWKLYDKSKKPRMLLMVSRFDHCLHDLLYRYSLGELESVVPLVVSNHPDCSALSASFNVPFRHIPIIDGNKVEQERKVLEVIKEHDIEFVVLARYMQILSDEFCANMRSRVINIHHSFLPSFKGAQPYHQAHARGVKLIGATAHFVTSDLDEGPIIEQDVLRVDHRFTPEQYVSMGRDVERLVLARAVKYITERRVLLHGSKTIVFS